MEYPMELIAKKVFEAIMCSEKAMDSRPYGIFEQSRVGLTTNQCDATSYNGWAWFHHMVDIAVKVVKELLPNSHVERISKSEYATWTLGERELGISCYCYVLVDGKLIVDVLYRNLVMLHCGRMEKFNSPYADYLYNELPPVFVGTVNDMATLVVDLEHRRKNDPEHADDILGDTMRWYRNPNSKVDIKLMNN